jgi:hypothetical protein
MQKGPGESVGAFNPGLVFAVFVTGGANESSNGVNLFDAQSPVGDLLVTVSSSNTNVGRVRPIERLGR